MKSLRIILFVTSIFISQTYFTQAAGAGCATADGKGEASSVDTELEVPVARLAIHTVHSPRSGEKEFDLYVLLKHLQEMRGGKRAEHDVRALILSNLKPSQTPLCSTRFEVTPTGVYQEKCYSRPYSAEPTVDDFIDAMVQHNWQYIALSWARGKFVWDDTVAKRVLLNRDIDMLNLLLLLGMTISNCPDLLHSFAASAQNATNRDVTRKIFLILLLHQVNTKYVNVYKQTSLHMVAMLGLGEICIKLIKRGLGVNDRDKFGKTPLHYAAQAGDKPTYVYLMIHGADENIKDMNGLTPKDYR